MEIERETRPAVGFWNLKPISCDTLPSTKPHLLALLIISKCSTPKWLSIQILESMRPVVVWITMAAMGSNTECLVIKEWCFLVRIQRYGLIGEGVALQEEVCYWVVGWALSFQNAKASTTLSTSCPQIRIQRSTASLESCLSCLLPS